VLEGYFRSDCKQWIQPWENNVDIGHGTTKFHYELQFMYRTFFPF